MCMKNDYKVGLTNFRAIEHNFVNKNASMQAVANICEH